MKRLSLLIVLAILFGLWHLNMSISVQAENSTGELLVVTIFQSMEYDVSLVIGDKCEVASIIPSGVDPHTYSLKPGDIDLLRKADIIISTRHTPVELQVDEMIREGELNASYIVLNDIPGIHLYKNPNTGQWNLHMIIYDPDNYRLFLQNLTATLQVIDPENKDYYQNNLEKTLEKLDELTREHHQKYDLKAIGSMPVVQYAVEWAGIDVIHLLVAEPGVGAGAQDVNTAKELITNGTVSLAVVSVAYDPEEGDKGPVQTADETMLELAESNGIPVLRVPLPASPGSMIEKLEYVVNQLEKLNKESNTVSNTTVNEEATGDNERTNHYIIMTIIIALAVIVAGAIIVSFTRRKV